MMKTVWASLACLCLAVTSAPAQEKDQTPAAPSASELLVKRVALAYDLIEIGREQKMPEALVTAALLLHKNPTEPLEVKGGEKAGAESPAQLLKEAKAMRPKD